MTGREVERRLKSRKRAREYCQWCAGKDARRMPGTTQIDIGLLTWEATSQALRS
jgi:hypothetical protein